MRKEASLPLIVGLIAGAVVILAVIGFIYLRPQPAADKPPPTVVKENNDPLNGGKMDPHGDKSNAIPPNAFGSNSMGGGGQ